VRANALCPYSTWLGRRLHNLLLSTIAGMTGSDLRLERAWQGLRAWSGFPAGRKPRPIVLLFPAVSSGGFPDGDKKMAFLSGTIEADPGFPDPLLHTLRSSRTPTRYGGPPLIVTRATLASHTFCTDRGRLQLPAWEVRARDVPDPIWVLDPSISEQVWQPPAPYVPDWPGGTAVVEADGRTVTMTFTGSPYFDYPRTEILESGGAAAIVPTPVLIPTLSTRTSSTTERSIPLVGQARQITVTLAEALAGRVLLDDLGSPVMVTI